jgi:hypothetical protein
MIRSSKLAPSAIALIAMLTIHERLCDDGSRETVDVGREGDSLVVRTAERAALLPMLALERVMERYAKPLEEGIALDGPSVDLGEAGVLYRIRHRGRYDVIARDFVVWAPRGREPVAELATSVSAALVHLARAAERA